MPTSTHPNEEKWPTFTFNSGPKEGSHCSPLLRWQQLSFLFLYCQGGGSAAVADAKGPKALMTHVLRKASSEINVCYRHLREPHRLPQRACLGLPLPSQKQSSHMQTRWSLLTGSSSARNWWWDNAIIPKCLWPGTRNTMLKDEFLSGMSHSGNRDTQIIGHSGKAFSMDFSKADSCHTQGLTWAVWAENFLVEHMECRANAAWVCILCVWLGDPGNVFAQTPSSVHWDQQPESCITTHLDVKSSLLHPSDPYMQFLQCTL